jgi:hypothetical protein
LGAQELCDDPRSLERLAVALQQFGFQRDDGQLPVEQDALGEFRVVA